MRQSRTRARLSQPTLFHPPQPCAQFRGLPQEIQDKTIRLLARLLRLRADRLFVAGEMQEARHE